MSDELQRITTTYVEVEDRLSLTGILAHGMTVQLWLTQRLLNRLVPPLSNWLQHRSHLVTGHAQAGIAPAAKVALADQEMVQGFAQHSARAQMKPQPPVHATPASATWVVSNVQLSLGPQAVLLRFPPHQADQPAVTLHLSAQLLRQWLDIVFDQVVRADWPTTAWPPWIAEDRPDLTPPPRAVVVH